MKSYNHIWEIVISPDNIRKAICKASLGKREHKTVKEIYENIEAEIPKFQRFAENYRHRNKKPRIIKEGQKERCIIVPSFKEQVLHHMIAGALQPIIMKRMYEHCHGSIPGRGPALAAYHIKKWIRHDEKNVKYFLKMDIYHFFASIPHDMLKAYIAKYIHDPKFNKLMGEVIDCATDGLPLGFHTSHWLANWYLQPLDTFIKQKLGAVHYVRYMDDMVIFGSNKRELHKMRKAIGEFLKNIGLEMKGNWQVARFHRTSNGIDKYRFLDFMGFRFYRNRTALRKNIMLRMTKRARRFSKHKGIYSCRKMIAALGWLNQTDTYGMYVKWMKPYISFRNIKRKISRYDRRVRREMRLCGTDLKAV